MPVRVSESLKATGILLDRNLIERTNVLFVARRKGRWRITWGGGLHIFLKALSPLEMEDD